MISTRNGNDDTTTNSDNKDDNSCDRKVGVDWQSKIVAYLSSHLCQPVAWARNRFCLLAVPSYAVYLQINKNVAKSTVNPWILLDCDDRLAPPRPVADYHQKEEAFGFNNCHWSTRSNEYSQQTSTLIMLLSKQRAA